SVNLHRTQEIVREYCAERNITYTETGLLESYGIVIRYLKRVGLGEADPFECPIIAAYRPYSSPRWGSPDTPPTSRPPFIGTRLARWTPATAVFHPASS